MTLRDFGGFLLDVSGDLAGHSDCCCDPPIPAKCQCIDVDDSVVPRPNVIFDVDYTSTAERLDDPSVFGDADCDAPASCPDVTGEYTVGCGSTAASFDAVFVCTYDHGGAIGKRDYYYYHDIQLENEFSTSGQMGLTFQSGIGYQAYADPAPTSTADFDWFDTDQSYSRIWDYAASTDCEPTISEWYQVGPTTPRYDSGCEVDEFTTDANWDT